VEVRLLVKRRPAHTRERRPLRGEPRRYVLLDGTLDDGSRPPRPPNTGGRRGRGVLHPRVPSGCLGARAGRTRGRRKPGNRLGRRPLGFLLVPVSGFVDLNTTEVLDAGNGAARLLNRVGDLVGEESQTAGRVRIVAPFAEEDVVAGREGFGIDGAGQFVGTAIFVDGDVAEVETHRRFEFGARDRRERFAAGASLDRPGEVDRGDPLHRRRHLLHRVRRPFLRRAAARGRTAPLNAHLHGRARPREETLYVQVSLGP